MTPHAAFQIVNMFAMTGWLVLAAGVIWRRADWRDIVAGRVFPLVLAAAYLVLIAFFFGRAEGGFDSLENIQRLFATPWVAVAGWLHYLAFDLFIGAWMARQTEIRGLPRWPLIVLLPLTLLFGPAGFLAFHLTARLLASRPASASKLEDLPS